MLRAGIWQPALRAGEWDESKHARGKTTPQSNEGSFAPAGTDSPAFKKWFGKSRVVDESGKPLVVYHGGSWDITAFDPEKIGTGRGTKAEPAFFFARDPETANHSAEVMGSTERGGAVVHPVYLRVEKPLISKMETYNGKAMEKELLRAIRGGYDGVFFPKITARGEAGTIAVFKPHQIKSAIGNRGTFARRDPRIDHGER